MQLFKRSLVVGALLVLFSAALQAQPTIQNFTISVWPEYDHPGVLVIFNGRMDATDLPTAAVFPVPERARFALVAGSTDTTANRMIPIEIQDGTTGKEIRFPVVQPEFHVEFYFNPFQEGSAHRHYAYDFTSNLAIDSLIVLLQQPMTAQGFEAEIPVDQQLQDNHGIIYYQSRYENIIPGKSIHVEAQYENPQGQLTTEVLQSQMGGTQGTNGGNPEQAAGGSSGPSIWLMFVVVALVAGALFFITKSRSKPAAEAAGGAGTDASGTADTEQSPAEQSGQQFCIHCGEAIPKGAKFCTQCGKSQSG